MLDPRFVLPLGFDPNSGRRVSVPTGLFGPLMRLVVPGGQAWLVTTISVPFRFVGAAGSRFAEIDLLTAESRLTEGKFSVIFGPFDTGHSGVLTAALGASTTTRPGAALNYALTAALPYTILFQGDAVNYSNTVIDPSDGMSDTSTVEVIAWYAGQVQPTPAELLGPFMLVPGPGTLAA